jgi:mycothiol synthase
MFTIHPFDHSDTQYRTLVTLRNAAYPNHPMSLETLKHLDAMRDPDLLYQCELIEHDGEPVAYGFYMQPTWSFNPDKYFFEIFIPLGHPHDRAIREFYFAHVQAALADRNPLAWMAWGVEDQPHVLDWLRGHGFEPTMRYPVSLLDLTTFDPTPFAGIEEKVQAAGVEIKTLAELQRTDLDWLQKLYDLTWGVMEDVPSPEPPKRQSPEQFQKVFDNPNLLPDCWFVALNDGDYVGESKLFAEPADPSKLMTGLTGVVREQRRKGIATALKLRAIDYAIQYGATRIETDNEENNPMYQINLRLGFQPAPAWIDFEKVLRAG